MKVPNSIGFEIPRPERFVAIELSVIADDGFIAYLNGERIGFTRMDPDGGYGSLATWAASEPAEEVRIDLTGKLDRGRNLIAVHGANVSLASSDFSLIPRVVAIPGVGSEEGDKRIRSFRRALTERNARAILAYLDGGLLARQGDHGGAAVKFREVLALDRKSREPFLRLHESLRESLGVEAADTLFRAEIEKGAPEALVQVPARKPRDLVGRQEGLDVILETAPFDHIDPRVSHSASRWQIRTEAGDYRLDPVFDAVSREALTSISLPAHRFRPETTYFWRTTHIGSAGRTVTSDESTFRTLSFAMETERFDLSKHFNIDVIANPGDELNGTIDGGWASLIVDGYDGTSTPNPAARGLPPDRRVRIHELGDYDHNNAIQVAEIDGSPIRVEVPRRRYAAIRFLVTCGWGKATVPTRLVYADGSVDERALVGDDWASSIVGFRNVDEGNVPIIDGMSRLEQGRLAGGTHYALFEVSLEVDPKKELVAFVLEGDRMRGESQAAENTRFNLFAATGVWVEERE